MQACFRTRNVHKHGTTSTLVKTEIEHIPGSETRLHNLHLTTMRVKMTLSDLPSTETGIRKRRKPLQVSKLNFKMAVSVLERSDKVILTILEFVQATFLTRNILKPNFHNCRGGVMLVDFCFSAGKIRYSHSYSREVSTSTFQNQECPKVQFPQL